MISNPLQFMFVSYSVAVSVLGIFVLYGRKLVPVSLTKMFKFGKMNKDCVRSPYLVEVFEVPKRWFSHFYIFASIWILFVNVTIWRRYFSSLSPTFCIFILDTFADVSRKATVTPEAVVVSSVLVAMQVCRRCYECHFVSVYSDAKMHILHYLVGMTYYFGAGVSLISEAPGFLHGDDLRRVEFSGSWFSLPLVIGVVLFLFGFILQWRSNLALANLRKSKDGNVVVSLGHMMPRGGWFELVSCPHYFAEITMYLSVFIIMHGRSFTWWLLFLFTLSNQIIAGLLSHKWYKSYFKNYPTTRKAVIPYLI